MTTNYEVSPIIPYLKLEFISKKEEIDSDYKTTVTLECKLHYERVNYGANKSRITPKMFKKYTHINPDGTFTVVGTATCSKNDVPDTTFGSHLAESRAKAKAFWFAYEVCEDIMLDIESLRLTMEDSLTRFQNLAHSTSEHVIELEDSARDNNKTIRPKNSIWEKIKNIFN